MANNPNAIVRFYASDIILNLHSDASYLSAGQGRSRVGGYFFLGSIPRDNQGVQLNDNIHITYVILKLVVASAAEMELGALFLNFSMPKKQELSGEPSLKWGILNHLHLPMWITLHL